MNSFTVRCAEKTALIQHVVTVPPGACQSLSIRLLNLMLFQLYKILLYNYLLASDVLFGTWAPDITFGFRSTHLVTSYHISIFRSQLFDSLFTHVKDTVPEL